MTPMLDDTMPTTALQLVSDDDTVAIGNMPSAHGQIQTVAQNTSPHDGCIVVRSSEMDYLPWDNPDNIVSAEVEEITHRIKDNLLGCLILIGGPANVINMAVFYKQSLKERVNLCLFALSLADELYLLVSIMLHAEQIYLQFTTKERYGPQITFLVNINFAALTGFCFVSPVLSAIIAVERCYCVISPLKFQTIMHTRTMAAIITAVYVGVLSLYCIVTFRYYIGCVYDPDSDILLQTMVAGEFYRDHRELIDVLDSLVFGVGLPGVVITVVFISTIITTVKLRQIVTWRAGSSSSLSLKEVSLTKMLIGNSILFIACVGPVALIHFVRILFPEMMSGRRNHNLYMASVWMTEMLCFCNATFNIFVYYAMGSRYRETFWMLFSRKRKTENT